MLLIKTTLLKEVLSPQQDKEFKIVPLDLEQLRGNSLQFSSQKTQLKALEEVEVTQAGLVTVTLSR
jgi:hypothetical protein